MKQLFTLAAAIAALSATAQPDFLYSNFPTATLTFTGYALTDPGSAQEPSDGANQTWDLSSATFTQAGTMQLTPAAGTPYAADYPAANWDFITIAAGQPADNGYLLVSSSGIENVASHVPSAPNAYTDYQRILAFPLSLGDSYTDTYASPGNTGSETWTYSGEGTLITPEGTFTNQLKMTSTEGDLVIWNASPIFPRFIADDDGNVTLLVEGPSAIREGSMPAALRIAPNPAIGNLQLIGMEGAYDWAITDVQGRQLLHGNNGIAGKTIDVSALATGSYLLEARNEQTRRTVRFSKW